MTMLDRIKIKVRGATHYAVDGTVYRRKNGWWSVWHEKDGWCIISGTPSKKVLPLL